MPPRPRGSRRPTAAPGILYVLHNDIAWQLLPLEAGVGSGQTCGRRLERWQQAGVFDRLHRTLLAELNAAGGLDWSRACRPSRVAPAAHGDAPKPCSVTRVTTPSPTAANCASAESCR
ncbi:transposase [Streptomyces sp. NPDC012756]|uniref:transposase n=1 Tax=Streptomyces sp. NPDC012756 TaxID=3364847 RepID=UPI00369D3F49